MIYVVSPAKSLNFTEQSITNVKTKPVFQEQADTLAGILNTYSKDSLKDLLSISDTLAKLNIQRYNSWPFSGEEDKKQAVFAFNGDVYTGLDVKTLDKEALKNLQSSMLILSGLYGVLRPLDMILPYRLEMGSELKTEKGKNLYQFWGDLITNQINTEITNGKHKHLINLASQEYFKSIQSKNIKVPIINIEFKESKNNKYSIVSFFAKKARGLMARFIAQENITNPEHLKAFDYEKYCFNHELSNENNFVFTR